MVVLSAVQGDEIAKKQFSVLEPRMTLEQMAKGSCVGSLSSTVTMV